MTHYAEELKASIIARMLPPQNASVPALAKETVIPKDTLYCWRLKARGRSGAGPDKPRQGGAFASEEKFAIVLETASFNELELGEYCRRKGLYPEQIANWKKAFIRKENNQHIKFTVKKNGKIKRLVTYPSFQPGNQLGP